MNNIYSVTQINNYIKLMFNRDRLLNMVSIRGEVSNCKYHSSGHIYFSLKDEDCQLTCVMFAGKRKGLTFQMEEGMSVVVTGSITVYERGGNYQMYAEHIVQEGIGALYERFELLKNKLYSEGLFDEAHKKPIPVFATRIGVITSRTGAALQDILNISSRRNPHTEIILYPALVQGSGAAKTLVSGIKAMEKIRPDVIIIGRGGGSIEDLFEFNNEELARAIYECSIPVISAVGHEIDYTICDYVSDLRAPTPSAAAELAVFEYKAFTATLVDKHFELLSSLNERINTARLILDKYSSQLNALGPTGRISNYKFRLMNLKEKLDSSFARKLSTVKHRLEVLGEQLKCVSPYKRLEDGYSFVTDSEGKKISGISDVHPGDKLIIRNTEGIIRATVDETISKTLDLV